MLDLSEDYLNSSDIIARINELEGELFDEDKNLVEGYDHEEFQEYENLKVINDEGEKYIEDWTYGATLVSEDAWVDYATDYIQEAYYGVTWTDFPYSHMDWEAAADELREDYYEIEIDGETYLGHYA